MKFGITKLESWSYHTVEKSFWHNTTGSWRTDRQTERQTRCCREDPR